jgi:hypothetical protein
MFTTNRMHEEHHRSKQRGCRDLVHAMRFSLPFVSWRGKKGEISR